MLVVTLSAFSADKVALERFSQEAVGGVEHSVTAYLAVAVAALHSCLVQRLMTSGAYLLFMLSSALLLPFLFHSVEPLG